MMSETEKPKLTVEQLQLRIQETVTGMKSEVCYLVTLEFDAKKFFDKFPCKLCKDKTFENHKLKKGLSGNGIWNVCNLTGISTGELALFDEYNQPLPWVKIVSEKRMVKKQVLEYLKKNRIVPEPSITMWLLR